MCGGCVTNDFDAFFRGSTRRGRAGRCSLQQERAGGTGPGARHSSRTCTRFYPVEALICTVFDTESYMKTYFYESDDQVRYCTRAHLLAVGAFC